mgnify:CR=1 FL=1
MGKLKLNYRLTREEIEESLLCIDWKREGRMKQANLIILTVLGVLVLGAFIREPGQFFLFLMLFAIIGLLFYLQYGPQRKRKKQAEKIVKTGGNFQISLDRQHMGAIWGQQKEGRKREKGIRKGSRLKLYISENMYTFKAGREIYAIPKRILSGEQKGTLAELAKNCQADVVNIRICRNT